MDETCNKYTFLPLSHTFFYWQTTTGVEPTSSSTSQDKVVMSGKKKVRMAKKGKVCLKCVILVCVCVPIENTYTLSGCDF